jgi:hypothetical protein
LEALTEKQTETAEPDFDLDVTRRRIDEIARREGPAAALVASAEIRRGLTDSTTPIARVLEAQAQQFRPLVAAGLEAAAANPDLDEPRRSRYIEYARDLRRRAQPSVDPRRREATLPAPAPTHRGRSRAPRSGRSRPRRTSRETRAGPDDGDSEPPGDLAPPAGRHTAEAAP